MALEAIRKLFDFVVVINVCKSEQVKEASSDLG